MLEEIIDEKFKKQIFFLLNNNWTGSGDVYFPLQNSVNIEKQYLFKLKNFDYIFYKKDTQETKRAILFLFTDKRGENIAVIIFKDLKIYKVNIMCPDEYYISSIFDISYAEDELCIYDTFLISGKKINKFKYLDRILEAETFTHNYIKADINITVTEYFKSISYLKDSLTENDELFMIPNDLPIITGTNYACFKWKPAHLITFSLLVKENAENLNLYSTKFKKEILFATIYNSDPQGKEDINCIKKLENYKDGCIIDINILNKIEIIRVNTFKTIPNTIRSIEKILSIKKENLKLSDIEFN